MKRIYDHSIDTDQAALQQFKACHKKSFVTAAALMPDAHSGYAAPIGSVLITKDQIVPAWVGFDIGCGLIAVKLTAPNLLEKINKNKKRIHSLVTQKVPMGLGKTSTPSNVTEETKEVFKKLIDLYKSKEHDKRILNFLKNGAMKFLGSIGSGNHFMELGTYKSEVWLIVHSGSRGLGHKVAERYMKLASRSEENYEKTAPLSVKSEEGKQYLNILDFCLEFALLNRLEIAKHTVSAIEQALKIKIKSTLWTNKNHNHALLEKGKYIHRKGATPAKKGERGIIPGSMSVGSVLVKGLGSAKFLHSSSHGAGRLHSRTAAKKKFSMSQFKESMKGVTGTISQKTLDEAPMAYKDLFKVMDAQKESVKAIKHIKPLINWKGT
ncbi:MAG: RNA-splicing ligase RtcB [Colwelliaceae bacterium]|nr:RNA-splicing ligase RtcB [Colwelliaceae bacterium]|tara:strand:+ start:474 stop:1613 length:1140 start_codon:yes stop_codon:yes gene_type:complete